MQSKELHIKPIHFLFTNDCPGRLPFQRTHCVTNMLVHYDRSMNSDGQGPLRHKQEKAMINEFECALKPKAYTKISPGTHEKYYYKVTCRST